MFRARAAAAASVRSATRAEIGIAAVPSTIEELLADKSLRKITLAIDVDPSDQAQQAGSPLDGGFHGSCSDSGRR